MCTTKFIQCKTQHTVSLDNKQNTTFTGCHNLSPAKQHRQQQASENQSLLIQCILMDVFEIKRRLF